MSNRVSLVMATDQHYERRTKKKVIEAYVRTQAYHIHEGDSQKATL